MTARVVAQRIAVDPDLGADLNENAPPGHHSWHDWKWSCIWYVPMIVDDESLTNALWPLWDITQFDKPPLPEITHDPQ
jgi:hypothetical protein